MSRSRDTEWQGLWSTVKTTARKFWFLPYSIDTVISATGPKPSMPHQVTDDGLFGFIFSFLSSQAHLQILTFLISCHDDILTLGVSPRTRLPSQVQFVLTFNSQWASFYQRAHWEIRTAFILTNKDEVQSAFTVRGGTWACGSVAVAGPHVPIGSGTIRRHSFVRIGVTLLEEVCHHRGSF